MKLFILIIVACSTFAFSSAAFGCECLETGISRSDSPAWRSAGAHDSTVVAYVTATDSDDLKVLTSFRGTKRKRRLKIINSPCSFPFEAGKNYMVFAQKSEKKGTYTVDVCGPTTELAYSPITMTVWTLADELSYLASKSTKKKYRKRRNTLLDVALKTLTVAAKKCDKKAWGGRDKITAKISVRFDVKPNGTFESKLVAYKINGEENPTVSTCVSKYLGKAKFKKFPGGPVSVRGYWNLDRIDSAMKTERKNSIIIPFKKPTGEGE